MTTDGKGRLVRGRFTGPALPFGAAENDVLGPKTDEQVIATSIYNILTTPKGSIPYNPEMGSVAPLLLFEIFDDITVSLLRHYTAKDIAEQEPRVVVRGVTTSKIGDYAVSVQVSFSIVGDPLERVLSAPLVFSRGEN